MTTPRDAYHYSSHSRPLRSPQPQDSLNSFFMGQGGRTVLPPLTSVVPTSRSPAPTTHSSQYTAQRPFTSTSYEYGPPASYNAPADWHGTAATAQPQPSGYPSYQSEPQARHPSPYYTPQPSRNIPIPPVEPIYEARHTSTPNAPQPSGWDDRYGGNYTFSGAPAQSSTSHAPNFDSGRYQAPVAGYQSSYTYNPAAQASTGYSYAYTPAYEPRNASTQVSFADPPALAPPPPSSSTGAARSTDVPGGEENAVKKKRKRADANQLKVLNEVYDRTPFPSTAEREALALRLSMTPRSVQIWFQNKRQAARQGGRTSAAPSASSGRASVVSAPAATSSVTALPGPAADIHVSSLALAVGVPSAAAPRGTAGYVASPPRMPSVSPPRAASTPGVAGHYDLRRPRSRVEEQAMVQASTSARRR